ncbi:hypothetical protein XbC2_120 [Xanthomonas phage XbC2]|nr:hypothetical protein XbC2_120 [Xanthomonas phage XbC2]
MNSDNLFLARDLLMHVEPGEVISTQYNHEYETRAGYDKYPAEVIEWLTNSKLLVLADVISISEQSSVEIFKVSVLGEQVAEFANLADFYDAGVAGEEHFLKTGRSIYTALDMFNEAELEPMVSLLTREEQDAYNHYYRIAAMKALQGRTGQSKPIPEIEVNDFVAHRNQVMDTGLTNMFQLSVELGSKGTDDTRTNNYVFKKCMEELGEMALEDNIAEGLSYKDAGSDGVAGEAVDLAICAMDMFALQHPDNTAEEIHFLFLEYMGKKLNKWKETLDQ